jgi:hypothetical protein
LYVHMIWISNKPYKTLMEETKAYVNKEAYSVSVTVFIMLHRHNRNRCSHTW